MAYDLSEITRRIQDIPAKLKEVALPVLRVEAIKSVQKNFESGGRPKWEPSVKKGKLKGTRTLVVSGKLSNVTADISGDSVILKTSPESRAYAQIQNEGGVINMPAKTVRHRKVTAGKNKGRTVFASSRHKKAVETKSKAYKIKIPARPFLVIPPEDNQKIQKAVEQVIRRGL